MTTGLRSFVCAVAVEANEPKSSTKLSNEDNQACHEGIRVFMLALLCHRLRREIVLKYDARCQIPRGIGLASTGC